MTVVVVLGMHKSGTTLIAETLHRSGIAMIGSEVTGGYDDGNKMERGETQAINLDLLGQHGKESLRMIRPLASGAANPAQRSQAKTLIDALGASPWGFKDPRTLLTFNFWQDVLETPALIGIFRDPTEVFGHYVKRAGRRWISRDPTYLPDALRAWCIYSQLLLDAKRSHPHLLLLDYADFMTTDTGMQRLSAHLRRDLIDCRKPAMRRAEAKPTVDYRLAQIIVRLRDGLDPHRIHTELMKASLE